MQNINEGSVAITHGEIEYLLVFIKNKDNLNNFINLYKNNNKINLEDYIDIKDFENRYGYKIKNKKPYGRSMEATYTFIEAMKIYYNVNILNFNETELINFLKSYVKEFPNIQSYTKLNINNWGLRSLEIKDMALRNLIKYLNLVKF